VTATRAAGPTERLGAPAATVELDARAARRVALVAQGLRGPRLGVDVAGLLRRLRAIQIDSISVLARSHELVPYTRLGPVGRGAIEAALWGPSSTTFEYWSHAACVLPLEDWPAFAATRRRRRARGRRWHHLNDAERSCRAVVDRLEHGGPLTARQLGGARRGGPWWDWSETKIAVEWLLDTGVVVCRARRGFQRIYDLAERAVPPQLLGAELDDAGCARVLVAGAARALGVATVADLSAYVGLPRAEVAVAASEAGLASVAIPGWPRPIYAERSVLEASRRPARGRSLLISPFDSLVWDRPRTERLFGLRHRLEAYVPRGQRVHGYYAMPVLGGDRLVALVDPGRAGRTLVAKSVSLRTADAPGHVARALRTAAAWVGCDAVALERVTPVDRHAEVERHLAEQ
jgi:uncharacterized protein